MNRSLSLTTPEWDAICELLEAGARQLSVEIRHTQVRHYREHLLARQEVLTRLLDKMRTIAFGGEQDVVNREGTVLEQASGASVRKERG
jgi:hypothetical protein